MTRVHHRLDAALRRVADAYRRCPKPPNVNGETWLAHEAGVDTALLSGDAESALEAIEAWEKFATAALEVDSRG